ncbi:hypothetical protein QCA50_006544 [Cerrena zonata]|uniref:Uncharacterized protein n=1 Tax=Cerrena zonata TaxID=2478898 RepID=A0AAW0GLE2_9APHY
MSFNDSDPALNSFTPETFMSPDVAAQTAITRDLIAITLGVWFWDVSMSISSEIQMWTQHKFSKDDVIYILTRITKAGCIIGALVFASSPLNNCQAAILVSCWLAAIVLPLNSLLFLIRILGVFHDSKVIKIGFSVLWFPTLCSFIAPFVASASHIGPTQKCEVDRVTAGSSSGFYVIAIYDTLVFIAITLRILSDNLAKGWKTRAKVFVSAEKMGPVFRIVLQTGQLYYLVTTGANIVALIILCLPSIPPTYKISATVPNLLLQNVMACRVFRLLKQGAFKTEVFTVSAQNQQPSSIVFNVSTPPESTVGASIFVRGGRPKGKVSRSDVDEIEMPTRSSGGV